MKIPSKKPNAQIAAQVPCFLGLNFKSASPDRCPKYLGVLAIIVPELELCNVKQQAFLGHLVIDADHAALNQGPETLNLFV